MADIESDLEKMNDLEIAANRPHTLTLMNKIGANINGLIDEGAFSNKQEFLVSSNFAVPEFVTQVLILACGGGRGAGSAATSAGDTTFGVLGTWIGSRLTQSGITFAGTISGSGATDGFSNVEFLGGTAGTGNDGGSGGGAGPFAVGGDGGDDGAAPGRNGADADANSGAGGGGGGTIARVGGSGAISAYKLIDVTPLDNITVTIGAGSAGGFVNPPNGTNGDGGSGRMIIFW